MWFFYSRLIFIFFWCLLGLSSFSGFLVVLSIFWSFLSSGKFACVFCFVGRVFRVLFFFYVCVACGDGLIFVLLGSIHFAFCDF